MTAATSATASVTLQLLKAAGEDDGTAAVTELLAPAPKTTEGASAVVMDADAAPDEIQVGGAVAFARMAILIVFPVLVALVGLLTGFSFAGGSWLSAIIVLLVLSALATLGWVGFRWWRYRRRARA